MIAKLYLYFGMIGIASMVAWVSALIMLINFAFHERRTFFYARAVCLAVAGLLLAQLNSHYVSLIQVDRTQELKEAYEQQRRAQQAEWDTLRRRAADIRFAEDGKYDQLDLAGVPSSDKRSIYEQAAEEKGTAYLYKKEGKQQRHAGRSNTPATADKKDKELEVEQEEPSEKPSGRFLPAHDVARADDLDKLNLWTARSIFLMALVLLGLDYFRRFNRTFGAVLPLPLSGSMVDALFPKKYSAVLRAGQPDLARRYLETTVRKGESFVYFGDVDVLHTSSLARVHIPIRALWRHFLDVIRPVYVLRLASRLGDYLIAGRPLKAWIHFPRFMALKAPFMAVLHRGLDKWGHLLRKAFHRMAPPITWLVNNVLANPWMRHRAGKGISHIKRFILHALSLSKIHIPVHGAKNAIHTLRRNILKGLRSTYAQAQKKCQPMRKRMNEIRAGIIEFWPVSIINTTSGQTSFTALRAPLSHNFIFECAWFNRYCFIIQGLDPSTTVLSALRTFLKERTKPHATALKTVHILWNFTTPVIPDLLRSLMALSKDVNVKVIVFAAEPQIAGLRQWVEEVCPEEVLQQGKPTFISMLVNFVRRIVRQLQGRLHPWIATPQVVIKARLEKIKTQRAAKAAAKTAVPSPEPIPTKPEAPLQRAEPLPKKPVQPTPTPPAPAVVPKLKEVTLQPKEPIQAPIAKVKVAQPAPAAPPLPEIPEIKLKPPEAPSHVILSPKVKVETKAADITPAETKPVPKVKITTPPPQSTPVKEPVKAPIAKAKIKVAQPAPAPAPKPQPVTPPSQPETEKKDEPDVKAPAPLLIVETDKAANIFKFLCPTCKRKLAASMDWQGKGILCPSCKTQITIPSL